MKVAAIIADDGQTVLPLVDGPFIRIRDTASGAEQELDNPALTATQGRRMATLQAMLEHGVEVVVAPPAAFCAHSHKVAQDQGVRFWNVHAGSTWAKLWEDGSEPSTELLHPSIDPADLAVHGHGHNHHHG